MPQPRAAVVGSSDDDEILQNHWYEIPDWPPGRQLWSVYLTFGTVASVLDVVDHYQQFLRPMPELDMVEPGFLHATIQGIQFTDELHERDIDRLVMTLREYLGAFSPQEFVTGAPETDKDAVQLPIYPSEPLHALRSMLRNGIKESLTSVELYTLPEPTNGFSPHVSIAYANAQISVRRIHEALEAIPPRVAGFTPLSVAIIKLRRESRRWSWTDELLVPLGTSHPEKPSPDNPQDLSA